MTQRPELFRAVATVHPRWKTPVFAIGIYGTLIMLYIASVHRRARRRMVTPPKWRLAWEALTFALLGLTAHLGGFLSGVNG